MIKQPEIQLHHFFLFAVTIALFFTLDAKSQVIFNTNDQVCIIGKSIQYYADSTATRNIDNIQKERSFTTSSANVPNLGLLNLPLWLKISITNKNRSPNLMMGFDQSMLEEIDFYYPKNNRYKLNRSGERYPFSSRMTNYHKFIYDLNIPFDSTRTYYIRIKSSQKMLIPVFLGKKDVVADINLFKNLLFGIFCGIIIVMFFYNLFIYFTVRDPIYLYYVIYILTVGFTQATIEGYTFQFLWPNNLFLATRAFFFLTAFVNICGLEFVRKFLNIKEIIPRLDPVFYIFYIVYGTAIGLTIVGAFYSTYIILQGFAGVVSIFILIVSIIIAKRNYRPAKFFLVAWIPLISGILIYVLREFSILPYNNFTNYSISIGTLLEVVLLSFALADKINIFKKEKEKSQEETLRAVHENARIIREQNVFLEMKVKERTEALEETNHSLNHALHDLKEAQSQLVDSEKMASLGQLTAGIAHEINNPINFVTSNIKPLQMDINDLNEVISRYEKLDINGDLIQQISGIESFKKQIDINFVRDEIKSLLSGIGDGAKRTAEIIRSLKNFSRLDENDTKPINLNEGLDSTLVLIRSTFPSNLKVIKNYGELPSVECMPGKINQVFMNLITNAVQAVKYKAQQNAEEFITITTWTENNTVKVSIKDSGTGMPEDVKRKIFEPFFTTKDVGEGTGLGLSIVFRIIESHHGNIDVNTKINQGTEFIITLPLNNK